ncbi:spore-associated protein A [Streptomyces sp. NPDC004134]|uniref:spore-associated protein A n=1 Tax=Streptomyces sp. NPDC004134 TaxID=3364691 RepID=UPI0036834924
MAWDAPVSTAAAGVAAVALAVAGVLATAPAASAATYNGACGSGYQQVQSTPITGMSGSSMGRLFLTYNDSTGYKCAVTVSDVGHPVTMSAGIKRSSAGSWVEDEGKYTSYAGPVYTYARGQCVDYSGRIDGASKTLVDAYCK